MLAVLQIQVSEQSAGVVAIDAAGLQQRLHVLLEIERLFSIGPHDRDQCEQGASKPVNRFHTPSVGANPA